MKTKLEQIEPYRSLAFSETSATPAEVVMAVPLAGNRNDKGSMFGGSIYSAMVLSAWRLCEECATAEGRDGDIFVKDSSISFLRPVWSDVRVNATLIQPPAETRRGNIAFEATVDAVDEQGRRCASMQGSFRLVAPKHND
ncbi:MAG: YiiD C-terminal domain-containing protein [Gammaproteobacteria bacterium]|jgi:thioesterase domain-containing protein